MLQQYKSISMSQSRAVLSLTAGACVVLGMAYSAAVSAQPAAAANARAVVQAVSVAESVAKVALVVGEAVRVLPSGQRQPLQLGSELLERDRISTGKDALVMLVFSDQGRMALRPDTELIIRSYRIDPSGADTKLDFELLRGTVRQISGQGATLQPERYRLNTPIAAIGVRGTDFLARVDKDNIQTYVHEGSIVLLPPSSDCGSHRGACDIWAAVNASDAGQYVVVSAAGQVVRSRATPDDVTRLFGIKLVQATPPVDVGHRQSAHLVGGAATSAEMPRSESAGVSVAVAAQPVVPLPQPVAPTQPVVLPVPLPELPSQLAWGRFSNPLVLPLSLPSPFDEVRVGRHVTVGQLGQYALWRDNPAGQLDASLRGQAEFSLSKSEAYYAVGGQTLPVQLDSATLSVNFDKSTFATQFGLLGAGVPPATVNVGGKMNDEGIFNGANAQGQRVAGALSLSASEAGYFFMAPAFGAAQYEGLTLWRAK